MFFFSWQRLHRELPLSAEELEDVFDSLDTDHTGYLTLEAFSSGFSRFSRCRGPLACTIQLTLSKSLTSILSIKPETNDVVDFKKKLNTQ